MDFKDRSPQFPGRVKMTPVSGQTNTYDMELAEGTTTGTYNGRALDAGKPLNKSTFDALQTEVTQMIANNPGPRGDTGPAGPASTARTGSLLVGINNTTSPGWYKIGHVQIQKDWDYCATMQITTTEIPHTHVLPNGIIEIYIRHCGAYWFTDIKWRQFNGSNPDFIKYTADINSGYVTFYARVPDHWVVYRIDILSESNRDSYSAVFKPAVSYGQMNSTIGYSPSAPNGSMEIPYEAMFRNQFLGTSTVYRASKIETADWGESFTYNYNAGDTYVEAATLTCGNYYYNILNYHYWGGLTTDFWYRFQIPSQFHGSNIKPDGRVYALSVNPLKGWAGNYFPGYISRVAGNYIYVCADENGGQGGISISLTWFNTK